MDASQSALSLLLGALIHGLVVDVGSRPPPVQVQHVVECVCRCEVNCTANVTDSGEDSGPAGDLLSSWWLCVKAFVAGVCFGVSALLLFLWAYRRVEPVPAPATPALGAKGKGVRGAVLAVQA
jgi:hypothetical protein